MSIVAFSLERSQCGLDMAFTCEHENPRAPNSPRQVTVIVIVFRAQCRCYFGIQSRKRNKTGILLRAVSSTDRVDRSEKSRHTCGTTVLLSCSLLVIRVWLLKTAVFEWRMHMTVHNSKESAQDSLELVCLLFGRCV